MSEATAGALRAPAIELAQRAGEAIMHVYAREFEVEHKADASPLTEADLAAHRVIVAGLLQLTPGLPVLSEESAEIEPSERLRWTRYWLVDPLDGTREFVKRNGEFTVNIALIEDGVPVLGVVYAPARRELAHGVLGEGAVLVRDGATRELCVGTCDQRRPRIAGSRSHRDERMDGFLERVGEHELIAMGSSLKFCLVAAGEADAYLRLGPTSEWDTAAGQCVLEAAGGSVVDLERRPLRYNQRESLINPDFMAIGDASVDWLGFL